MTRTQLVLSAASAMYHGQTSQTLTEYDAWSDADENTRAIYIKMALASYRRFGATVNELRYLAFGSCLCLEVLHRVAVVADDGAHCKTCGGET